MKMRMTMLCVAAVAIVCASQTDASAAGRRGMRMSRPAAVQSGNNSILPSMSEIAAVPVPQQGALVAYPVDVVRYGLNVHPGARLARRVFGR